MKLMTTTAIVFSALVLTACGNTPGERAASGGAIGAGAGAAAGLLMGSPVQGAIIGGAVGAGTGAMTDNDQINLGKPIWK